MPMDRSQVDDFIDNVGSSKEVANRISAEVDAMKVFLNN